MTVLRAAVFNLLFYGITLVLAVLCLPLLLGPRRAVMGLARLWIRITLALLRGVVGLDYRVLGRDRLPAQPAIFAVKHQSAWDTLALNVIIPDAAIVLKRELYFVPLYGWYLWRAGMIGIDRSAGGRALRRMTRRVRAALAAGRSVIIFPEGTRTRPGTSAPYHPGVAALYLQLDRPVVPVALNSGRFWGRRSFLKRPGTVTVAFLDPIEPGLDRKAFMATLHDRIEGECRALEASAEPVRRS